MRIVAKARITSYMEDDCDNQWITEGRMYDLGRDRDGDYMLIDDDGDLHYVGEKDLGFFFEINI